MLFEGQIHDLLNLLPWVRIKKEKRALRALIEQRRRVYGATEAQADSLAIVERIEQMPEFKSAQTILVYYPIHNEVDLRELVRRHTGDKTFLLPVTHKKWMEARKYEGKDKLKRGRFSVPEPQTEPYKGSIDLILAPGVVFDKHLNRIGRGGGYYDKFLKEHKSVHKIGVCYDFQLKKREIPHLRFDQKMDQVVTPSQTIG